MLRGPASGEGWWMKIGEEVVDVEEEKWTR